MLTDQESDKQPKACKETIQKLTEKLAENSALLEMQEKDLALCQQKLEALETSIYGLEKLRLFKDAVYPTNNVEPPTNNKPKN